MPKLQIAWSQATEVPSNPIQGYEISYKLTSGTTWTSLPFVATTATSYLYDWVGAEFNKMYNFRIRTKYLNNALFSSYKIITTNTVAIGSTPLAPTSVINTSITPVSLSFDYSGAYDEYGIKGYILSISVAGSGVWTDYSVTNTNTYFSYTFTGLAVDTNYNISVRTVNVFDMQSTNNFNTAKTATGKATGFTSSNIVSRTETNINVKFSGADFIYAIQGYYISYKASSSGTWIDLPFIAGTSTEVTRNFTGLTSATAYDFKATLLNEYGVLYDYYTVSYSTVTPAPAPIVYRLKRSDNGVVETIEPCLDTAVPTINIYAHKQLANLTNGDRLYTNTGATSPFRGGNAWRKFSVNTGAAPFRVFKVDGSGYIIDKENC